MLKRVSAVLIQNGKAEAIRDMVAEEASYELYLNDKLVDTMVISPSDMETHAVGFLVNEGFIESEDVKDVVRRGNQVFVKTSNTKNISLKTPCKNLIYGRRKWGKIPLVASSIEVSPALIVRCAQQIPEYSENWKKTGGIHCSILFDQKGEVIRAAEDIGRWNTVDKVVGYALLHRIVLSETILGCSGRQPEGMVLKAARAKIPIVVTKAAVIDRGIEAAHKLGITLIGFAREDRFTIYAHPERVQTRG